MMYKFSVLSLKDYRPGPPSHFSSARNYPHFWQAIEMSWNYISSVQIQWRQQRFSYQPSWGLEPTCCLDSARMDYQAIAGLVPPANIFVDAIPTYRSLPSNPYTLGPIAYDPPLSVPAAAIGLPFVERWDLFILEDDIVWGVWPSLVSVPPCGACLWCVCICLLHEIYSFHDDA